MSQIYRFNELSEAAKAEAIAEVRRLGGVNYEPEQTDEYIAERLVKYNQPFKADGRMIHRISC